MMTDKLMTDEIDTIEDMKRRLKRITEMTEYLIVFFKDHATLEAIESFAALFEIEDTE